jgi:hypothetical protein
MREVVNAGGFEILSCTVSDVLPWRLTTCVARKLEMITGEEKGEYEDQ